MKGLRPLVAGLAVLAAAATASEARAQGSYRFAFSGPGLGGTVKVTYGPATDAKYPDAFKITSVSGRFTNTNNGLNIVNAPIGALVPTNNATPDATNLLAPAEFSRYLYTGGSLSYSNLFWPGGSPQTASDYPFHGGFLDIYGLLFDIGGGRVVNVWSDGNLEGGPITYGAAVANASGRLDDVFAGVTVSPVPEPGVVWLVGAGGGLLGVVGWRRRRGAAA